MRRRSGEVLPLSRNADNSSSSPRTIETRVRLAASCLYVVRDRARRAFITFSTDAERCYAASYNSMFPL